MPTTPPGVTNSIFKEFKPSHLFSFSESIQQNNPVCEHASGGLMYLAGMLLVNCGMKPRSPLRALDAESQDHTDTPPDTVQPRGGMQQRW